METQTTNADGGARGVDVAGLERELASMWRESARGADGGEQAGVTRVCVLNLIVYSAGGEARASLGALLGEVSERMPCRAVVLIADRDSRIARLDASASLRCQSGARGGKQVCGEQVTIEAAGAAVESVASAVEPLLVPDIPTFLWWQDIPHYEDKLFSRLVALADRVVIDSGAFDHPPQDLARVARLVRERPRVMLSDLNWGRLTTWRDLVAGFWDAPAFRAQLDGLDEVEIEFTPPAAAPGSVAAQALLSAGWLASRLGWRATGAQAGADGPNRTFRLDAAGRAIRVSLRAAAEAGPEGGALSRVALRNTRAGAEFVALKSPDWTKLETSARIGGQHTAVRVLAYESRGEGQRLTRELSLLSRDRIYEEAVASAEGLIATLPA
ncbi:MAG: glucose-6-phosphate dehydrogenase assembly protein OpcA [Acidobacteria bacterium]|nr:glucose-6-phosphate dehydrogenase assembly protein OpcA [Acidobacteriota bacterium]